MLSIPTFLLAQDTLTRATQKTSTVQEKREALAFAAGVIMATTTNQEHLSFARNIFATASARAPLMLNSKIQTTLVKLRIIRTESIRTAA